MEANLSFYYLLTTPTWYPVYSADIILGFPTRLSTWKDDLLLPQ